MYKHKANQLKKKSQIQFAVVSSPVGHMTPVTKLSLQFKKKKGKQASKALQHYYVHSFSSEMERAGVMMRGKGREMETPMKQESFLAQGLQLADHRDRRMRRKRRRERHFTRYRRQPRRAVQHSHPHIVHKQTH